MVAIALLFVIIIVCVVIVVISSNNEARMKAVLKQVMLMHLFNLFTEDGVENPKALKP